MRAASSWLRVACIIIKMLRYLAKGRAFSTLNRFATVDPDNMTEQNTKVNNLVGGAWTSTEEYDKLIDPMTGKAMGQIARANKEEIKPFIDSLNECPKHGMHNPFKNPERYLMYGDINRRVAEMLN